VRTPRRRAVVSKFALVAFPDEKRANAGVRALEELRQGRSVMVHGTAVLQRDEKGALSVRKRDGVSLGVGIAALVGGLAVPFLQCVEPELAPGHFAVVAEISEQLVTSIDAQLKSLDGRVVREWGDDFLGHLLEKRANARAAKLAARTVVRPGIDLERMTSHLTRLIAGEQEKLERAAEDLRNRLDVAREQLNGSIAALQNQAAHATPEMKIRIEQRIASLRQEFVEREQRIAALCQEFVEREWNLQRACQLTRDAIRPRNTPAESRRS